MRETFPLPIDEVEPGRDEILKNQGIPAERGFSPKTEPVYERALLLFRDLADPKGLLEEIGSDEVGPIFKGEGRNDRDAPLAEIHPVARRIALYAVTLGHRLCDEIGRLFRVNDPALGSLLDSVASAGAERATCLIEERFDRAARAGGEGGTGTRTLGYSPGYCGWHITAQKRLFERLRPEEIGITLGESCLMKPIKSVSGLLLFGPAGIHRIEPGYSFCGSCSSHPCLDRLGETL